MTWFAFPLCVPLPTLLWIESRITFRRNTTTMKRLLFRSISSLLQLPLSAILILSTRHLPLMCLVLLLGLLEEGCLIFRSGLLHMNEVENPLHKVYHHLEGLLLELSLHSRSLYHSLTCLLHLLYRLLSIRLRIHDLVLQLHLLLTMKWMLMTPNHAS